MFEQRLNRPKTSLLKFRKRLFEHRIAQNTDGISWGKYHFFWSNFHIL